MLHPRTSCPRVVYIRLLAWHSTLYIICILYVDNMQVAECRVPPDSTSTLHSPYIMPAAHSRMETVVNNPHFQLWFHGTTYVGQM